MDVSERTVSAVFIDLLINKRTTSPQLFDRVPRAFRRLLILLVGFDAVYSFTSKTARVAS